MSEIVQFDTSTNILGGVNVAEAIQSDKKLVFNESYTITGEVLSAPSIYACYDLTVVGNLEVEDIEVRGNLYVIGNIKAKRLSCQKAIFCSGDIDVASIVGSEVVANDIKCHTISCPGNVVARTTIDISKALSSKKTVIAGEGILGSGYFSAKNAVATEYFDFDGEVRGKTLELETDSAFGEGQSTQTQEETTEELLLKIKERIGEKLKEAGEVDENELVDYVCKLSQIDKDILFDWKRLTNYLIEISYQDRITNLRDYLVATMAKKVLPQEIVRYETIGHVIDNLLPEASTNVHVLPFCAEDVDDFAYALKITLLCKDDLEIGVEEAMDRIFQSVGIKYKTVSSFFGKAAGGQEDDR